MPLLLSSFGISKDVLRVLRVSVANVRDSELD